MTVQIGTTNGLPVLLVPSGFTVSERMAGGLGFECERTNCHWELSPASGVHLTELATLAIEHVQEEHHPSTAR